MAGSGSILERVWQHLQDQIDVLQADVEILKSKVSNTAFPTRATMLHSESLVTTGSALTIAASATAYMNIYASQIPSALGDTFTNNFTVKSGTYTLAVYGLTGTTRGIITFYIDGTSVSVQDWYAGSTALLRQTATFTVDTDGVHVLRGVLTGTNPSSGGYSMQLSAMTITPQVD